MDYSPEVLIYLQNFRRYLDNNEDVKKYFLQETDGEEFFKHLSEISEKNFKRMGQPELTIEQFEFLRKTILIFKTADEETSLIFEYETNKINFHLK
jgi:hypothetical protein